jgi:hypothetical protein
LHKSIIVVLYQYIVVDRSLAKVGVEGSNPFARSSFPPKINGLENHFPAGGVNFAVFGSCSDFRENVRISGGSDSRESPTINESAAISALGVMKLLAVKSVWTEKILFPKREKDSMFGFEIRGVWGSRCRYLLQKLTLAGRKPLKA